MVPDLTWGEMGATNRVGLPAGLTNSGYRGPNTVDIVEAQERKFRSFSGRMKSAQGYGQPWPPWVRCSSHVSA
eukprot:663511-Pyramimonas_sp.AAC.1